MKKLCILISIIAIIVLSGCSIKKTTNVGTAQKTKETTTTTQKTKVTTTTNSQKNKENTTALAYKDGVYTAYSDKWKFGQESAVVTIKHGKMIYVTLKRLDTNGKEVNYNDWIGQKETNGSIKPNLKKYRVDMAKRILTNQTYQVDTIAGATVSTSGWKLAVQRALDKAK